MINIAGIDEYLYDANGNVVSFNHRLYKIWYMLRDFFLITSNLDILIFHVKIHQIVLLKLVLCYAVLKRLWVSNLMCSQVSILIHWMADTADNCYFEDSTCQINSAARIIKPFLLQFQKQPSKDQLTVFKSTSDWLRTMKLITTGRIKIWNFTGRFPRTNGFFRCSFQHCQLILCLATYHE